MVRKDALERNYVNSFTSSKFQVEKKTVLPSILFKFISPFVSLSHFLSYSVSLSISASITLFLFVSLSLSLSPSR